MDFLAAWWHIVADPAHMAAEVTFMILVDLLFLGLIWPLLKRAIVREHHKIDSEHGVENHGRIDA